MSPKNDRLAALQADFEMEAGSAAAALRTAVQLDAVTGLQAPLAKRLAETTRVGWDRHVAAMGRISAEMRRVAAAQK